MEGNRNIPLIALSVGDSARGADGSRRVPAELFRTKGESLLLERCRAPCDCRGLLPTGTDGAAPGRAGLGVAGGDEPARFWRGQQRVSQAQAAGASSRFTASRAIDADRAAMKGHPRGRGEGPASFVPKSFEAWRYNPVRGWATGRSRNH